MQQSACYSENRRVDEQPESEGLCTDAVESGKYSLWPEISERVTQWVKKEDCHFAGLAKLDLARNFNLRA